MKKKLVSVLLCAAMVTSMVAGCGSSTEEAPAAAEETASGDAAGAAPAATGEEDGIIRIGAVCAMTGGSAIYGEGAQNAIDLVV